MSDACSSDNIACQGTPDTRVVRTIRCGDTTYELFVGPCKCCQRQTYRVMRSCGHSFSVYEISEKDAQDLDAYISELHSSFAMDVATKLMELRDTISEFNSKGLFEARGMQPFAVRLIDKARLICNRFGRSGHLERLLHNVDDPANDLASAFILGCIATENHWRTVHEDAVNEGYALIEGREVGRPLALAARVRQGKRTRHAVMTAASKLYESDPLLRRNDTKTAAQLAGMKLETLRKRDGTFLGTDAIVKHLRAIRTHANSK